MNSTTSLAQMDPRMRSARLSLKVITLIFSAKLLVSLLGSITTRKDNFCTSAVIKFLTISEYSAEGHGVIVYAMHNRAE